GTSSTTPWPPTCRCRCRRSTPSSAAAAPRRRRSLSSRASLPSMSCPPATTGQLRLAATQHPRLQRRPELPARYQRYPAAPVPQADLRVCPAQHAYAALSADHPGRPADPHRGPKHPWPRAEPGDRGLLCPHPTCARGLIIFGLALIWTPDGPLPVLGVDVAAGPYRCRVGLSSRSTSAPPDARDNHQDEPSQTNDDRALSDCVVGTFWLISVDSLQLAHGQASISGAVSAQSDRASVFAAMMK